MFTPDLDLVVSDRCSIFQVKENTGVDTGDGTLWDGVAGLVSSTLTAANVRIVDPDGSYSDTDVLAEITSPVTAVFWFDDMTGTDIDGLHNLVYTLETVDISITAFADYTVTFAGTVKVTCATHLLVTGMYVIIAGSTSYDGTFLVTRIDADNFYITATWVADDGAQTGTTAYRSTFYPYVYCRAEAGIDKMYATIAITLPGLQRTEMIKDANTAKGLLNSLISAITSSNTSACDRILAEITQVLSYYEVDANL